MQDFEECFLDDVLKSSISSARGENVLDCARNTAGTLLEEEENDLRDDHMLISLSAFVTVSLLETGQESRNNGDFRSILLQ